MKNKNWFVSVTIFLALVGMVFFWPQASVEALPQLQMTPGVNPMSISTVTAPTNQPGTPLTEPNSVNGSMMTCPMMGSNMSGMSGMNGMSSGTGMQGMSGMAQMGSMSTYGSNSTMPMRGINDQLYTIGERGWFDSQNPWQWIGWILLFALILFGLVMLVLGVLWLIRQFRKGNPTAAG